MKKISIIILSVLTIISSSIIVVNHLVFLDIPSNKNEQYASFEKTRINNRTDINECEKKILITEISLERNSQKKISNIIFPIQFMMFVIIIIQIILLVLVLMTQKKEK